MIELLVGNISSGKSTYALQKAREGWLVINDDAIVNALHANDYTLYNHHLKPIYKLIENTIFNISVAHARNLVIDRGVDINRESRKRWITLARSLDQEIHAVEFDRFSPEIHAQRRHESNSRGISYQTWLKIARRHNIVYFSPTLSEGFISIKQVKWYKEKYNEICQ